MGNNISIRRLFAIVCLFVLAALVPVRPAAADIQKASLADKPIRLIEAFHEQDSTFPQNLTSDQDVFVIVYASASTSDVYVLARPSVDPQKLARTLESAVSGTQLASEPVLYMNGKGFSWADAYVNRSRMWTRKSEMRHPVGLIISRLSQAGFRPHTILCNLKAAKVSHNLHLAGFVGRKWIVANVRPDRRDLDFSLRARLSSLDVVRGMLLVLSIPIVGIAAIPVFIYIARSRRATPAGRRSLFTNGYFWLMMICMAVTMTAGSTQLRSPLRFRLEDLWFGPHGNGFTWFLLPVATPCALIPLSRLVARLVFRGDASEIRTEKRWYMRGGWLTFLTLFTLLIVADHLGRFLPQSALLVRRQFVTVVVLWFFLERVFVRMMSGWTRLPGPRTTNDELLQRLSKLASQLGLNLKRVDLVDTAARTGFVMRRDGVLLVSRELVEKLSPEEFDFVAMHEFAHAVRRHRVKTAVVLCLGTMLVLVPGLLFVTLPFNPSPLNWQLWTMGLGAALLAVDAVWLNRRREEEADRIALDKISDPQVAVQAVMKTSGLLDEPVNKIDKYLEVSSVNPTAESRLRWLKKAAGQMDLDTVSAFGKAEQDEQMTARAQEVARQIGMTIDRVEVVELAYGKPMMNAAALSGGRVIVGRALMEHFSPEEMDFILAHELIHLKRRHVAKALAGMLTGVFLVLTSAILIVFMALANIRLGGPALWTCMLGCALLLSGRTWISRRRELEADRMALCITRNLPAALSALRKLSISNPMKIPEELEGYLTHPKDVYRVRSLREKARRLGLADVEPKEHAEP